MKKFLAIYLGTAAGRARSGWDAMDEATRQQRMQQGIAAWHAWGNQVAQKGARIVDNGGPLGKTKRAAPDGISDTSNAMTGYVILEAESHQAAAELFAKHPHFTNFPGESVEIMEILPIPAM